MKGVYNPSKAAANLLSETLRVELAPFGVQVITVRVQGIVSMRGGVLTSIGHYWCD